MKYALYILTALQLLGFVSSLFITGSVVSAFNDSAKGFLYMTMVWVIYFAFRYLFMKFSKKDLSFKTFHTWFFREDLNLEKKWWHRAFLVVSFLTLAISIFNIISDSFYYDKKFSKIDTVNNHINSDVLRLSDIVRNNNKEGYVVSENGIAGDGKDSDTFNVYKNTTYCSTDIDKLLIDREGGIKSFYLKDDSGKRFSVNKDTLVKMMKNDGSKCVTIDSFTDTDYSKVYFLEPLQVAQDLGFYKLSPLKTFLNSLVDVSGAVAIFLGVLIFYYKILLYIIFGSKKNSH